MRLNFGKYSGRLISDIAILDMPYVKWCLREGYLKINERTKQIEL